jgi:uncharacterized protein (TIGR04222 family)
MNPFDFNGPAFLLFYIVLAAAVLTAKILIRRRVEGGATPRVKLSDPYLIAYLRGGSNEALRVATVSLVDRKLLNVAGDKLTPAASSSLVRRPIEKAVMTYCASGPDSSTLFNSDRLRAETEPYRRELEKHELFPGTGDKLVRLLLTLGSLAVLAGIAGARISISLSRGHTNVVFLVFFALAACYLAVKSHGGLRTVRGDAVLDDLRSLFEDLKVRARDIHPGGATSELALLAAVWGVAAVPTAAFPHGATLFPRATTNTTSLAGCGASCGSSCGSSCGGGCGGGCGGCGG